MAKPNMAEAESNASLEIVFYSGAYSIVETCEECCVGALVDRVCLCHFPAVCYGSYGEVKYIPVPRLALNANAKGIFVVLEELLPVCDT